MDLYTKLLIFLRGNGDDLRACHLVSHQREAHHALIECTISRCNMADQLPGGAPYFTLLKSLAILR